MTTDVLASIIIRSDTNNAGIEVTTDTLVAGIESLDLYAAGYDQHTNYISALSVTWASTGNLDTVSATGTSFTFSPVTFGTSGFITADDEAGHTDETLTITVIEAPITTIQELKEYIDSAVISKIDNISTDLTAVQTDIETDLGTLKTDLTTELTDATGTISTTTNQILTATGTESLADLIDNIGSQVASEVQPHVQSGILGGNKLVEIGSTVVIRYQTASGLVPKISVYDENKANKISQATMTEMAIDSASGTSVYEYSITFL